MNPNNNKLLQKSVYIVNINKYKIVHTLFCSKIVSINSHINWLFKAERNYHFVNVLILYSSLTKCTSTNE